MLHDSFGFDFPAIARVLDTTPVAARKLASRARAKVRRPAPEDELADREVVDAFMAAPGHTSRAGRVIPVTRAHTTDERRNDMKTMTCRQLGGPCELEHRGETADDVIKAQDRHLKDAEKAGDETHREARDAMKGRWRHPKKSMGWYRDVKQAFADLPQDQPTTQG